jgi:hypothetical protein
MRLSGSPVIFPHAGASRQSRFAAQKMTRNGNAGSAKWFRKRGAESRTSAGTDYCIRNASTCRPSRRRTIQNSSTVSKVSESEVAAAAP